MIKLKMMKKQKRKTIKLLLTISILTLFFGCSKTTFSNENIDIYEIQTDQYDLKVAKVDPLKTDFEIYQNKPAPESLSIGKVHQNENSILTFNGSFYTPEYKPTGLLISNGKILNPPNKTAKLTNGIFLIDNNNQAKLIELNKYLENEDKWNQKIQFALQNGPILIKNNEIQITSDDQKVASRTAIATDEDNQIYII
ncbi:hypothetical protein GF376_03960, partial [Candidatus Peregrinibacteria bacterium]|nr:hypothetical protein [Candidatus Peregrinibacteria bacterium]